MKSGHGRARTWRDTRENDVALKDLLNFVVDQTSSGGCPLLGACRPIQLDVRNDPKVTNG